MASDRRIARLESLIQARVAELLQREVKDPRLGFVTIQRVELDREITQAKIYWSAIGDDTEHKKSAAALSSATKFLQREVAAVMPTRNSPRLKFVFDESIEGAIRIENILKDVLPPEPTDSGADEEPASDA